MNQDQEHSPPAGLHPINASVSREGRFMQESFSWPYEACAASGVVFIG